MEWLKEHSAQLCAQNVAGKSAEAQVDEVT
jgi:hypothetical protein